MIDLLAALWLYLVWASFAGSAGRG